MAFELNHFDIFDYQPICLLQTENFKTSFFENIGEWSVCMKFIRFFSDFQSITRLQTRDLT